MTARQLLAPTPGPSGPVPGHLPGFDQSWESIGPAARVALIVAALLFLVALSSIIRHWGRD
jgi:hypothetical protein